MKIELSAKEKRKIIVDWLDRFALVQKNIYQRLKWMWSEISSWIIGIYFFSNKVRHSIQRYSEKLFFLVIKKKSPTSVISSVCTSRVSTEFGFGPIDILSVWTLAQSSIKSDSSRKLFFQRSSQWNVTDNSRRGGEMISASFESWISLKLCLQFL